MSREGGGGSLLSTVWMIHGYTGARTGVGNPVLELELFAHPLGEVLFYFVEPPFMYARQTQFTLAAANAIIRDEVLAWESAIRLAQAPGPA